MEITEIIDWRTYCYCARTVMLLLIVTEVKTTKVKENTSHFTGIKDRRKIPVDLHFLHLRLKVGRAVFRLSCGAHFEQLAGHCQFRCYQNLLHKTITTSICTPNSMSSKKRGIFGAQV